MTFKTMLCACGCGKEFQQTTIVGRNLVMVSCPTPRFFSASCRGKFNLARHRERKAGKLAAENV